MVRTGILLYDPRGQNDPRNCALDDQLDRLRGERNLFQARESMSTGQKLAFPFFLIKSILNSDLF